MNEAQETQGRWQVRRERDPDGGTGIMPVVYYDGCAEDEEIWMPHSPIGARRLAEQLNDLEARLADAEQRAEAERAKAYDKGYVAGARGLHRTLEELRLRREKAALADTMRSWLQGAFGDKGPLTYELRSWLASYDALTQRYEAGDA